MLSAWDRRRKRDTAYCYIPNSIHTIRVTCNVYGNIQLGVCWCGFVYNCLR